MVCEQHLWRPTDDSWGFTGGVCNGIQTTFVLSRWGCGIWFQNFDAVSCFDWNENEAIAGNVHPFWHCLRIDAGIEYGCVCLRVCVCSLSVFFLQFLKMHCCLEVWLPAVETQRLHCVQAGTKIGRRALRGAISFFWRVVKEKNKKMCVRHHVRVGTFILGC